MIFKTLFGRREAPPQPRPKPLINLEDARARHIDPEVPSPCISVCRMDPSRGLCSGCYRTVDEIAAWGQAGEAERLAIWARIESRQVPRELT